MRSPVLAGYVSCCAAVLATLTACGDPSMAGHTLTPGGPGSPGSASAMVTATSPRAMSDTPTAQPSPPGPAGFGSTHRFASGLVVTVSQPKTFQPSNSAYPRTKHAAAFAIILRNEGNRPYELSSLSVSATINGKEAEHVVDATQGYVGIQGADEPVQPEGTARLALAFAVPDKSCSLRLILRPDAGASGVAVYKGAV